MLLWVQGEYKHVVCTVLCKSDPANIAGHSKQISKTSPALCNSQFATANLKQAAPGKLLRHNKRVMLLNSIMKFGMHMGSKLSASIQDQSSSVVNKATPRLVQCAADTFEGNRTSMTKLVLWPVVLRVPRRSLVLYIGQR